MKFKLFRNLLLENINLLLEDIEAVKKLYPNISDEDFNNLLHQDPTYREGSNSVGKYTKWLLNLVKKMILKR